MLGERMPPDSSSETTIDHAWVERTFLEPEHTEVDRRDPSLRHALRRIPERDDRVLRVVYNDSLDPPRIVTAYFDRRQRGKP